MGAGGGWRLKTKSIKTKTNFPGNGVYYLSTRPSQKFYNTLVVLVYVTEAVNVVDSIMEVGVLIHDALLHRWMCNSLTGELILYVGILLAS